MVCCCGGLKIIVFLKLFIDFCFCLFDRPRSKNSELKEGETSAVVKYDYYAVPEKFYCNVEVSLFYLFIVFHFILFHFYFIHFILFIYFILFHFMLVFEFSPLLCSLTEAYLPLWFSSRRSKFSKTSLTEF